MTAELRIEIHADAAPLEAEWRDLEGRGAVTAFQRYDYVAPLYAAFVAHRRAEPLVVVVRAATGAPPLMILPLCRYRDDGVTVIGFADIRVADYCAPVVDPSWAIDGNGLRRLWRRIERALPACDVIRLRKLPERVGAIANPLLQLRPLAPYHVRAHGVAIAHPWADHAAASISKKQIGEIRRNARHLAEAGPLAFAFKEAEPAAESLFETLYDQRTKRFAALGRNDVIADPMWAGFYRDLVRGDTARPYARVMSLTAGPSVVACGLGLVHDGAFLLLIPSFDMERFGKYGPGRQLIYQAMVAFAAQGIGYFDLTIGDEPYKQQFGVDDRILREIVRPRSLRGRLHALVWHAKVGLRRHPGLRARLKRILGHA